MFDKRAAGKSIHFSTGQTHLIWEKPGTALISHIQVFNWALTPKPHSHTLHKILFPEASPSRSAQIHLQIDWEH